jgi:hypothetical protein
MPSTSWSRVPLFHNQPTSDQRLGSVSQSLTIRLYASMNSRTVVLRLDDENPLRSQTLVVKNCSNSSTSIRVPIPAFSASANAPDAPFSPVAITGRNPLSRFSSHLAMRDSVGTVVTCIAASARRESPSRPPRALLIKDRRHLLVGLKIVPASTTMNSVGCLAR